MKPAVKKTIKGQPEHHIASLGKMTVRDIVGIFQDSGELQTAIDELQSSG